MNKFITVFCTVPTIEVAKSIAHEVVQGKIAACVNIIPAVQSVYIWKDTVCDDNELLLLIKTQSGNFDILRNKIEQMHPYELPEIIALPILHGNEDYLNWILAATQ